MGDIFLVRHGETTMNQEGVIQGPRVDSELSPRGHAQAGALREAFAESDIDAVYASPMLRARDTAAVLAEPHRGQITTRVVPELYEMDFGFFCGQRIAEVRVEIEALYGAWQMGFVDHAFPGGESPILAQHRVRVFANGIRQHAIEHQVVVVAHGRLNRILIATLTGTSLSELERFPQDNANITHLHVDGEGLEVRRLNDIAHLN